jgi:hypothetical protein
VLLAGMYTQSVLLAGEYLYAWTMACSEVPSGGPI